MGLFDHVKPSNETARKLGKELAKEDFQTKYLVDENGYTSYYTVLSTHTPTEVVARVDVVCKPKKLDEPILRTITEEELCDGKPKYFELEVWVKLPIVLGNISFLRNIGKLERIGTEKKEDFKYVDKKQWVIQADPIISVARDNELYVVIRGAKVPCKGILVLKKDGTAKCVSRDMETFMKEVRIYKLRINGEEARVRVHDWHAIIEFTGKLDYEKTGENEVEERIKKRLELVKKILTVALDSTID